MVNFRSFRNHLLILLVASRFASASILETFVKNFRIWCHWRLTGGASYASFIQEPLSFLQNVRWLQVYNFYQPTIERLIREPVLIFHILLYMLADEVNNQYIRSLRRVNLEKRVEKDVHGHFFFIVCNWEKKITELGNKYTFLD